MEVSAGAAGAAFAFWPTASSASAKSKENASVGAFTSPSFSSGGPCSTYYGRGTALAFLSRLKSRNRR